MRRDLVVVETFSHKKKYLIELAGQSTGSLFSTTILEICLTVRLYSMHMPDYA